MLFFLGIVAFVTIAQGFAFLRSFAPVHAAPPAPNMRLAATKTLESSASLRALRPPPPAPSAPADATSPPPTATWQVDVEGFEARALSGAASLLAGTLSCDGAPLESPMIVHVEIFPALIRGAGNEPEAPLRILAATHDLFVGVGEGTGGARAVSEHHAEWAKLGKRLRHGGGRAFELPSEQISAFV